MLEKLVYKKYQATDSQDYYPLVKDSAVMRYISGKGLTQEEAASKFELILQINEQTEDMGYFKIMDSASSQQIGECKLVYNSEDATLFEIGYLLKSSYWKQGLGTRICQEMLDLATKIDPNRTVIALIDPQNKASRSLLAKFNFQSIFVGIADGIPTEKLILER